MQVLEKTAPNSAPIPAAEFAALMTPLAPGGKIAVGVSGGPDSMALCLLLQEWGGAEITALTVDHGLRAESAEEAQKTAAWLQARGIAHHILPWVGAKPSANIQDAARRARYDLLRDFCRKNSIGDLCVAHNLEDVAENFLLRLARGSGLFGLSAMAPVSSLPGLRLLRPLLEIPKSRLIATLHRLRQNEWIEDPSNQKSDFARARLRADADLFARHGLTAERLAETARNFRRARSALETMIELSRAGCVETYPEGFARLSQKQFAPLPEEIGLRILAQTLTTIGGQYYTPRLHSLENLYEDMRRNAAFRTRTLSGCCIAAEGENFLIYREAGAAPDAIIASDDEFIWDGRFAISGAAGARVSALGEAGWAKIASYIETDPLPPYPARLALPAFYRASGGLDEILTVPHLNYWNNKIIDRPWPGLRLRFSPHNEIG